MPDFTTAEALGNWMGVELDSFGVNAPTNVQTNDYTLAASDANKVVEMNKGTAVNLTVPASTSVVIPVGTVVSIFQLGAGQVTVVQGSGVTIRSPGGKLKLTGQYSSGALRKRATDEWVLTGDITT